MSGQVLHFTVTLNKSLTLKFNHEFTTAVVGDPDIADVLPINDKSFIFRVKKSAPQIYLSSG